jgi:hypothetical protein
MKFNVLSSALLATGAAAFPNMDDMTAPLREMAMLEARQNRLAPQGVGALPLVPPPFNAAAQRVSTTGNNRVSISSRPEQVCRNDSIC